MSDRQAASHWAQELLSRDNWTILDTETTGLGNNAQICQIAVYRPTWEWQRYVRPTVPIEPGATAIHGITDERVIEAPTFDQSFLGLLRQIDDKDLVIYNAEYDLRLIRQSLRAHGIQIAFPTSDRRQCRIFTNGGSIHCAMHWYSQWVGERTRSHQNYKWQKLPGGDHSALGDCKAVLEVIKRMAQEEG
jgi:DNA polymerase III subunit epsilon